MDLKDMQFVSLIRQFPGFSDDHQDTSPLPGFGYMDPDSEPLVELRTRFRIAEMVEGMPEVDAVLTLLKWVYDAFPYDGSAHNPPFRDALTVLSDPHPYNCWVKAIVLNEVYLSIGLKSRILFCFPADFDHDNHVVTMVYARSLGKWISVDAAQNTYFVSDDGTILNAIEARHIYAAGGIPRMKPIERTVDGPLVFNGIQCDSYDEFYRMYMSKDCFRFACPTRSEFRYDSQPGRGCVLLNPLGYDRERGAGYDAHMASAMPVYYTHSVSRFLAAPEGQ